MVRTSWPTLALGLALSTSSSAEPAPSAADMARMHTIEAGLPAASRIEGQPVVTHSLADEMSRLHVPGVSITYFANGRILWAKGYGLADVANRRPVTPDTLFQAASISKPVSAVAAMSLVQQGKLRLDEDVNLRLKAWKIAANPYTATEKVTLRRLLSHMSGLTVHGFAGYDRGKPLPDIPQILDGAAPANSPPVVIEAPPGSRWSYSGGGYVVAQLLMTEATGQAYPKIVHDRVLAPAGMTHSTYEQDLPAKRQPAAAIGYHSDGSSVTGGWHVYPEGAPAALWTTPSDLARFAIAFQQAHSGASGRMLSKTSADEMLKPQWPGFGIGFALGEDPKAPYIQHGGSNAGFQSQFYAFTDPSGRGVAIMTNGDAGILLLPEIVRAVAMAYDWPALQPQVRRPVSIDSARLDAFAGAYQVKGLPNVTVTREGQGLKIAHPLIGKTAVELYPQSSSSFFAVASDLEANFITDASGQVTKVAFKTIYGAIDAVRAPGSR